MSEIPKDNLYTRDHEWLRIDGDKAEVGITDHAQKALGDIVFVELPAKGSNVEKSESSLPHSHVSLFARPGKHVSATKRCLCHPQVNKR